MDIEQKIMDVAQEIDTLKAKGGSAPAGVDAIVAEMPMAGKVSPEDLMEILNGIRALSGKSPEAVAKVLASDDGAREALMRALANAIDQESMESEDAKSISKMQEEGEPDES